MRRSRRRQKPTPKRGLNPWVLGGVVLLAVVIVGGLIWASQPGPEQANVDLPSTGKVLGDPNAPVTVEEWGDFQ